MQTTEPPIDRPVLASAEARRTGAVLAVAVAAVAAVLMDPSMRPSPAVEPRSSPVRHHGPTATPGLMAAVRLLCDGGHAQAYGRFVALANDGDVQAGRIALVLHDLGPTVFRSEWDASTEQLETWARWSSFTGVGPAEPQLDHSTRVLAGLCGSEAATASVAAALGGSSRHASRPLSPAQAVRR